MEQCTSALFMEAIRQLLRMTQYGFRCQATQTSKTSQPAWRRMLALSSWRLALVATLEIGPLGVNHSLLNLNRWTNLLPKFVRPATKLFGSQVNLSQANWVMTFPRCGGPRLQNYFEGWKCIFYRITEILILQKNTDVTFSVEGQLISAHKFILTMRSEYFEKMFSGEWAEAEGSTWVEFEIHLRIVHKWCAKFFWTNFYLQGCSHQGHETRRI